MAESAEENGGMLTPAEQAIADRVSTGMYPHDCAVVMKQLLAALVMARTALSKLQGAS